MLQWNIERGYQLPGIIEELKRIDADVIALQEIDVGCARSGSLDTGGRAWDAPSGRRPAGRHSASSSANTAHLAPAAAAVAAGVLIAEALGLNYLFLCEFEELASPLRDARTRRGGDTRCRGCCAFRCSAAASAGQGAVSGERRDASLA